jgi:hypothetical protein
MFSNRNYKDKCMMLALLPTAVVLFSSIVFSFVYQTVIPIIVEVIIEMCV